MIHLMGELCMFFAIDSIDFIKNVIEMSWNYRILRAISLLIIDQAFFQDGVCSFPGFIFSYTMIFKELNYSIALL